MPSPRRVHPAWIVLGAVTLCMVAGSGLRSVFGVYIKPMEAEFGWGRGALSGAAAISLLVLGAAGPLVGRLADRWGPRRVVTVALVLLGAGAIGAAFVQRLWHVYLTTGLLMALGAGGLALTTASTVAARWFEARRGVAIGIAAGGMSAGQLVVIPLAMALTLALEHNFSELQASTALGVMGAMNVLGTVGSGWICDRFGRRGPLAFYYFVRGLSLLFLLYVWNAPSLHLWAAIFGLNYISTVPPTTTLTANIFGRYSVGELLGWIFFAHQVGAALGAALAGWIYEWTGAYTIAFVSAALMGFLAAGLALAIREEPIASRPMGSPAPAIS